MSEHVEIQRTKATFLLKIRRKSEELLYFIYWYKKGFIPSIISLFTNNTINTNKRQENIALSLVVHMEWETT